MNPPPNSPVPDPGSVGNLKPGQAVGAGRYLLKQIIGQGGMGVVWLAHDTRLREPVALKFLPAQIAFDAAALDDLRRETMRSRKLSHPNIVRIHDLNEGTNEPTFISMEYVNGPNLHNLRANRPARVLSWKFLAPLVRQLCSALEYAHGEGIIHRDLKPANLMLDANERLKLADFGVACAMSDSLARLSGGESVRGTLDFMSPQQADGKKPQVSDDIYSLGATLYDLLTSRPPFYTGDIAYQVRQTRPDSMKQRLLDLELSNEIPSTVSALVMACLAKAPDQRPASISAILQWLDSAEANPSAPSAVGPSPIVPPPHDPSASSQMPIHVPASPAGADAEPMAAQPRERRSTRLAVLVLCALAVAGSAVFWGLHRANPTPEPRTQVVPETPPTPVEQPAALAARQEEPPPPAVTPDAFETLFNGRDLTGWRGDPQFWSVHNGIIVGRADASYTSKRPSCLIWTGPEVQDFELRLAVLFNDGNSGVYYRAQDLGGWDVGGYQFEIYASNTGNVKDTGTERGSRQVARRPKALDIGALFKKGQWNNIIITAQGIHLTHRINGQVVTDVADTLPTAPRRGLLAFEVLGPTSVQFKDVRLKRLTSPAANIITAPAAPVAADGYQVLFNGRDLAGWEGDLRHWSVKDGAIVGRLNPGNTTKFPTCLAWRGGVFTNFELRMSCCFFEGHSGVMYRARDLKNWKSSMEGYEFTLASGEIGNLVDRVNNNTDRDLKRRSPAEFSQDIGACWNKEAWNEIVITAQGGLIRQEVNGHTVAQVNDRDLSHPTSGMIALKLLSRSGGENAKVFFKDIRIKPLPTTARAAN